MSRALAEDLPRVVPEVPAGSRFVIYYGVWDGCCPAGRRCPDDCRDRSLDSNIDAARTNTNVIAPQVKDVVLFYSEWASSSLPAWLANHDAEPSNIGRDSSSGVEGSFESGRELQPRAAGVARERPLRRSLEAGPCRVPSGVLHPEKPGALLVQRLRGNPPVLSSNFARSSSLEAPTTTPVYDA